MNNINLEKFIDYVQSHNIENVEEFIKIKEAFDLQDCEIKFEDFLEPCLEDATTNSADEKTPEEKKQELLAKYKI